VSQNESISSLVIVFNETTENRTTYRCIARNSLGSTLSEEATLTVARREARGRFQRVRQFLIFTPNNTGTHTFIITVRRKYLTNVTVFTLKYIYVIHQGPVHITPEEFENGGLFLLLGLPCALIRHENGAFLKRSSNRRNLKTLAFRICVEGKHFENGAFQKRWRYDNYVISLTEVSSNTNPK